MMNDELGIADEVNIFSDESAKTLGIAFAVAYRPGIWSALVSLRAKAGN
jgi:hypothetical protein